MPRTAYVNGRYVPHARASVHVEDRGYQFADGVYEVCEVARGYIVDMTGHLNRLGRSMNELQIVWPMSRGALEIVIAEVVRRNGVKNGLVYLQVTRGVASRDFLFPTGVKPSLVVIARKMAPEFHARRAADGIRVITVPENRWERVDIKSTGLLPNVLAKEKARQAGAQEAWFIDADGKVKEGASSNAWIVTQDGVLVTRAADSGILRGITRTTLFEVADRLGLAIEERSFSIAEAKMAREAFISSATTLAMPVVAIDDEPVANGHPGSVVLSLREAFFEVAEKRQA